ncbi:Arginase, catabolizes arginine to ornithine and urea [Aspergillus nanangensis]|uniref:Arginase n=1 Tax=Aspergillus nanangensis TaxID=2582783 RepID=A0AAD4CJL6_ASPNN|nr:Arginase, catabolizes arginine to ornithine and urea [Aspergillus nanangensis]
MATRLSIMQKFLPTNRLQVVAANFGGGGPNPGPEQGPNALIRFGLLHKLQSHPYYEVDFNDKEMYNPSLLPPSAKDSPSQGMHNPHAVSHFTQSLSQEVYHHARQGKMILTLGGDHSIAIGTLTGAARAARERLNGQKIAVVYVDAHADINTPETSPSGYIHGMSVAFATGIAKRQAPFDWIREEHLVDVKKVVYIGLRDVDDTEWKIMGDHGIKVFDMKDVKKHGVQRVMDSTMEYIGADTPIHLSYDVDALDPTWVPSTTYPVDEGLTLEDGRYIARRIHETGSLFSMDLVEVNPGIETSKLDQTLQSACSLVYSALGQE